MTPDEYVRGVVAEYRMSREREREARRVGDGFRPVIAEWAGERLLGVEFSGSLAKGTAIKGSTDVDLFISLRPGTSWSLEEMYEGLYRHLCGKGYTPRRQNVSIGISCDGALADRAPEPFAEAADRCHPERSEGSRRSNGEILRSAQNDSSGRFSPYESRFQVDLVPAKRRDDATDDHWVYRSKARTWTQTNIRKHIEWVRGSGRIMEICAAKIWRNRRQLEFPSFCLELAVVEALKGLPEGREALNFKRVLHFLSEEFAEARLVDPANTNNVVSEDLTAGEKMTIAANAKDCLTGKPLDEIIR